MSRSEAIKWLETENPRRGSDSTIQFNPFIGEMYTFKTDNEHCAPPYPMSNEDAEFIQQHEGQQCGCNLGRYDRPWEMTEKILDDWVAGAPRLSDPQDNCSTFYDATAARQLNIIESVDDIPDKLPPPVRRTGVVIGNHP